PRIGHRPRQGRGQAPITVARKLASDPPKRLPDSEGRSAHVDGLQEPDFIVAGDQVGAENSAEHAAIPDEARTREDHRLRVRPIRRKIVEDVEKARGGNADDRAPDY